MPRSIELELAHGADTLRLIGDEVEDLRLLWREAYEVPELQRFFERFPGRAPVSVAEATVAVAEPVVEQEAPPLHEQVTSQDIIAAAPRHSGKSRSVEIINEDGPCTVGLRMVAEKATGFKLPDDMTNGEARAIITAEKEKKDGNS